MKFAPSPFRSTLAGRLGLLGVAGIGLLCLACSSNAGSEDEISDRERDRTTTAVDKLTATARASRTERAQLKTPSPSATPKVETLHGVPLYPRLQAVSRPDNTELWPCGDFIYGYAGLNDPTMKFIGETLVKDKQCFTVGSDTLNEIRSFYEAQAKQSGDWTVTGANPSRTVGNAQAVSGFGQMWTRRNGLEQVFVGVMPSATSTGYVVLYAWSLK